MEKKLRKFLIWFWVVFGVSIALMIVFYVVKFAKHQYSANPADWGVFGDYFGALGQTIIGLANLVIFVKLTILVSDHQKNQSDKELDLQQKIVYIQLRSESVKNISEHLNSFFEIIKNSDQKRLDIIALAGQIDSFCKHNGHLFNKLDKGVLVQDSLIAIAKCYEISYKSEEERLRDLQIKISKFYSERDIFIQILHKQIFNFLDDITIVK